MKRPILFFHRIILLLWLGGLPESFAQLAFTATPQRGTNATTQEGLNSLSNLLKKLESFHKTSFVYQRQLLENKTFSGPVNENDKLEAILERVLTPVNLRFKKLKGGGYTILPRKSLDTPAETLLLTPPVNQYVERNTINGSISTTLLSKADFQLTPAGKPADIVVKGKVTDTEKGEPIPGVSIVLRGGTKGTNTDASGTYSRRTGSIK